MAQFNSPLKHVKVAAPCSANWEEMFSFEGERVRYCSQCKLNVYNLSQMKRREAETLLMRTEGRLCVRFYRRPDGSVLTQNCPIGVQAIKARVSRAAQFVLGMGLGLLANIGLLSLKDTFFPRAHIVQENFIRGDSLIQKLLRASREAKTLEALSGKETRGMEMGGVFPLVVSDNSFEQEDAILQLPTRKRQA